VVWDAVFIGIISQQALKWIPCARHDSLQIRILTVSLIVIGHRLFRLISVNRTMRADS
jgi:hypothetical protein